MIEASPRIIVLDIGLVEVLAAFGLDNNLALMPEDPAFVGLYPDVKRYRSAVNIESLMLLKPDIILGGNVLRDRTMMMQADRVGIKTSHIDRALPVEEKVKRVATLFGREAQGQVLLKAMETDLQTAKIIASRREGSLRAIHLSSSGAGGDVALAGKGTPAYELIKRAGGENLDKIDLFSGYKPMTAEGLIMLAPDVVIVSELELEQLGGKDGIWKQVKGLAATPAGIHHRLIVLSHKGLKNGSIETANTVVSLAKKLADTESS